MTDFDPFAPGNAPRMDHVMIDEETQMMRYLAEIAMADLELLPPESERTARPDGLLAAYRSDAAARHAEEADGGTAPDPAPEAIDIAASVGTGVIVRGPQVAEFIKPGE